MQCGLCALRPRACIKVNQPNFTGKSISVNKIRVLVDLNLYNIPNIPSPRHEMLTRITHASISRQVSVLVYFDILRPVKRIDRQRILWS